MDFFPSTIIMSNSDVFLQSAGQCACVLFWIGVALLLCYLAVLALVVVLRRYVKFRTSGALPHLRSVDRSRYYRQIKPVVVGFFHPYCNAGGGGERVLWAGIRALQNRYNFVRCVVYTGDQYVSGTEILRKAEQRFNISLLQPVEFVFLKKRRLVEASTYPFFTLLGQSFGSVLLGWEAMTSYLPDIFIDTMGYAFTLPLFKYVGGCNVSCYVHYPTISTDMLSAVGGKKASFNNASFISNSRVLSAVKLVYYWWFAFLYCLAGLTSNIVMVNSTWTYNHIVSLWRKKDRTAIVYPPCDNKAFLDIPIKIQNKDLSIVSIGQFRPEKDHPLQIRSFHRFLQRKSPKEKLKYQLKLVGSCRNKEDESRVQTLRELARTLGIEDRVTFCLNVSFDELKAHLGKATIGLHTMWNEHFGIGVVECMAAGSIVLAHDSGGPKMDIVIEWDGKPTGFLASDEEGYAKAMEMIFSLQPEERSVLCHNARSSISRFSENAFESGFLASTERLFMGM